MYPQLDIEYCLEYAHPFLSTSVQTDTLDAIKHLRPLSHYALQKVHSFVDFYQTARPYVDVYERNAMAFDRFPIQYVHSLQNRQSRHSFPVKIPMLHFSTSLLIQIVFVFLDLEWMKSQNKLVK